MPNLITFSDWNSVLGDGGPGGVKVAERYGTSRNFAVEQLAFVGLRPVHLREIMSDETLDSNKISDKAFEQPQIDSIKKRMEVNSKWVKMAHCEELGKARIEDLKEWKKIGHTIDTSKCNAVKLFRLLVECMMATVIHLESDDHSKVPKKIKGKNNTDYFPFV